MPILGSFMQRRSSFAVKREIVGAFLEQEIDGVDVAMLRRGE